VTEHEDVVPVLRVRDARAAAKWYARLGFEVEWTHQFEPGLPLFLAIARDGWRLFLSEHTGDAPGPSLVYLTANDVNGIAAALGEEARDMPWGTRELWLTDPDGNRLRIGSLSAE
jgi:catechol 2,3-dioxygenase-like lactoylglutathione lyase family enzyme